jgi:hypothetical protein
VLVALAPVLLPVLEVHREDDRVLLAPTDWDYQAFDATSGRFSEKCEAGVMAVAEKFHLAYYARQGSDLTRKTKKP